MWRSYAFPVPSSSCTLAQPRCHRSRGRTNTDRLPDQQRMAQAPGLLHVEELLDEEVTALAGGRYARKDASVGGRRHGRNPGTVGLAGQRVPISALS